MTTNLLLSIAWTHVSTRVRQTLVGMFGVAMGVGFTIMMAGLMQGSQIDFLRQLVDTMPHVTVEDERRSVPSQPAEEEYAAVGMSNVPNVNRRPGIKYPDTVMASLRSWLNDEIDDGLAYGRQARLRRWTADSFFSAPLVRDGDAGGMRKRSWS